MKINYMAQSLIDKWYFLWMSFSIPLKSYGFLLQVIEYKYCRRDGNVSTNTSSLNESGRNKFTNPGLSLGCSTVIFISCFQYKVIFFCMGGGGVPFDIYIMFSVWDRYIGPFLSYLN